MRRLAMTAATIAVIACSEPRSIDVASAADAHAVRSNDVSQDTASVCRVVPVDNAAAASARSLCIQALPARFCIDDAPWPMQARVRTTMANACEPEDCILNAASANAEHNCAGVSVRSRLPVNDS